MLERPIKYLNAGYLLLSAVALWVSWSNFLPLIGRHGFIGATLNFWELVRVNEASRFITVDAFVLGVLCCWWLLAEARRLRMKWAWGYITASLVIGISFAFPLFLVHRNYLTEKNMPEEPSTVLSRTDIGLMGTITALAIGYMILRLPQ